MKSFTQSLVCRFSIKQRLGIIYAMLLLIVIGLVSLWLTDTYRQVAGFEEKLNGLELFAPLYQVVESVQKTRGLTNRYLAGDENVLPSIRENQLRVEEGINQIQIWGERGNNWRTYPTIRSQFDTLKLTWPQLTATAFSRPPAETFAAYSDYVGQWLKFSNLVIRKTGLSYDPEYRASYLVAMLFRDAPVMVEAMGVSRGLASGLLASGKPLTNLQQQRLAMVSSDFNYQVLADSLMLAFDTWEAVPEELRSEAQASKQAIAAYSQALADVLSGKGGGVTSAEIWRLGTDSITATNTLVMKALPALTQMLVSRIYAAKQRLYWILALSLLVGSLAFWAMLAVLRDVLSRLHQVVAIFDGIKEGNFHQLIDVSRQDELGRVMRALEDMKVTLAQAAITEKRQRDEILKVQQALNQVNTSIMMADNDRNIVYMNRAAKSLFGNIRDKVSKSVSGLKGADIESMNMDMFHTAPKHQQELLANLTHPHKSHVKIGEYGFNLTAAPVFGEEGERMGTVVEWVDVTEQIASEEDIEHLIEAAGQGDLTQRISLDGKSGFYLDVASKLNRLMEQISSAVDETARVLDALACGELRKTVKGNFQGVFGKLQQDANTTGKKLTDVVCKLREVASAVTLGADEIAAANRDLSARTELQSANVEETAASMEQMATGLKSTSEISRNANELTQNTTRKASDGTNVVNNAIEAMRAIDESSQRIAEIITVIDEIAFQTNLLALNASVEAARAGEQGRGFAVVAGEVRSLAQRSAAAAKEIKHLISDSVERVKTGSELVNDSGSKLEQIRDSIGELANMIAQIDINAREQANGVEQVSVAVCQMDTSTQQNAAMVEQTANASAIMADQAKHMMSLLSYFSFDTTQATAEVVTDISRRSLKPAKGKRGKKGNGMRPAAGGEDGMIWDEF
ncbi:methyl-accepting chemotaxis protein [Shewanella sp. GXUN23E]|uniref:methyl-accepting chemotaxis protein n=1 Tax=Shewanella sp. GXUN23E TaxID=3422498 RepID=UPI003D7C7B49